MKRQDGLKNHRCVICGEEYRFCKTCDELKSHGVFSWRSTCDTAECFQIFLTIDDYKNGRISKEDARNMLRGIAAMSSKKLEDSVKLVVDEIME